MADLPKSELSLAFFDEGGAQVLDQVGYSVEQLDAYAAAKVAEAVAAERERCAMLVEATLPTAWPKEVAAAIRGTKAPNPQMTGASPVDPQLGGTEAASRGET